jgi:hypothetical protein
VYGNYDATPNNQNMVMEFRVNDGSTTSAQLEELHEVHGLNSNVPLVVNITSRTAGANITQTIAENNGDVTVTRT